MEKETRNKIRRMVQAARAILETEIGELLEGVFGLHRDGTMEDISLLPDIRDDEKAIKAREGFAYFFCCFDRKPVSGVGELITFGMGVETTRHFSETESASGSTKSDAVQKLILELTFTHLNRLVALKLMERRKVIRETVSRLTKSNGFIRYVVDVLGKTDFSQIENIDVAYQDFILYQCQEVADEIKVLFDPEDLSSYVFPRPRALREVLEIINSEELADIWDSDETIGWFYQYFTPKEMREQARAESSAPRNSWELAFRNQFYTPRYVVQFLTDNTLGRMWYEMLQGNTVLAECCKYMVKPPNEVFLQEGEEPSAEDDTFNVPFREKKDPRELKILDPACGSGHFLLYVFDLLVTIYKEAYADAELSKKLQQDYPDRDEFEREIPRLILENNLYGIDIDMRAIQIAALALWLRAQREWNEMGVRRDDRPKIRNAHFVCAEPMPGNEELFEDFVATLKPALLGRFVRDVWEKMKLAGEAGSLLQIEQELRATIQKAKQEWLSLPKETQLTLFGEPETYQLTLDFKGIKDEAFFKEAEEKVFSALRTYAKKVIAENHGYGRRLFAEESIRGFQFIETLQNRFDVVLMNPPFGAPSAPSKAYIDKTYPRTKNDVSFQSLFSRH
ncbi:MAG: DNA methyltransferase [Pseudomonadota bacterium]